MNPSITTKEQLKQVQFIHSFLTVGPFIFFLTCLFMYTSGNGFTNLTGEKDVLLIVFTAIHFALLGLLFPVSIVLPLRFARRYKKVRGEEASGRIIVSAHILKLAIMEIPVIFGLVIVFLSIVNGVMYEEPLYWVNTSSFFIFVTQNLLQFPSQVRIDTMYESTF